MIGEVLPVAVSEKFLRLRSLAEATVLPVESMTVNVTVAPFPLPTFVKL